jgi:hypothetical protein
MHFGLSAENRASISVFVHQYAFGDEARVVAIQSKLADLSPIQVFRFRDAARFVESLGEEEFHL